jgi:hypothetical protein
LKANWHEVNENYKVTILVDNQSIRQRYGLRRMFEEKFFGDDITVDDRRKICKLTTGDIIDFSQRNNLTVRSLEEVRN